MAIRYIETKYGFEYGSASVERLASDAKKGWVVLSITTPKHQLQVYVTKTGKTRIYKDENELNEAKND